MENKRKLNSLDDYRHLAQNREQRTKDTINDEEFFRFPMDDYQDAQLHSSLIDNILDIPVSDTEKLLRQKAQAIQSGGTVESWSAALHDGSLTWVGLNPAQLQTPYAEICELLDDMKLSPGQRVIDLGAGYGRMGVIMGHLYPECEFLGYEMAQERVDVGNQAYADLKLDSAKLFGRNIASDDFELPVADHYFIYDFGNLPDMKRLIAKLDQLADQKISFNVVARGRGINSLIQETAPWLSVDSRESGNCVIYTYV
ncbi:MAG: methyltransferase [Bacteriovoracaceae bacterium]|nr:methyltransferase [Bacteriovoracaceae bacterium]